VPTLVPSADVEARAIARILSQGIIVIASGGGWIPVVVDSAGDHAGLEAAIDKDRAGEVMAQALGADTCMMPTDGDRAFRDFGEECATPVGEVSGAEAKELAAEGHFLAGSMGPKMTSALKFVEDGGAPAIISSPDRAVDALFGRKETRRVSGAPLASSPRFHAVTLDLASIAVLVS
jgi:carbamate kinase